MKRKTFSEIRALSDALRAGGGLSAAPTPGRLDGRRPQAYADFYGEGDSGQINLPHRDPATPRTHDIERETPSDISFVCHVGNKVGHDV